MHGSFFISSLLYLRQFYNLVSTICKHHEMRGRHAIAYCLAGSLAFNIPTLKAQETSPPSQAPTEPVPVKKSQSEDLVLQLFIDGTEMQEFVQGILKDGQLYLPLSEISIALDFPITVDADKKNAGGWFISDKYEISLTQTTANVKGKKTGLQPGSIIVKDQDLYIDATLMQKWFPMDFSIDTQNMTLNIATREALPYMEALLRKKLYARLAGQKKPANDIEYKNIHQPYALAQWPSVDVTLSTTYQNREKMLQTDYSGQAVGEFGYLTAKLYAAGNYEQRYAVRGTNRDLSASDTGNNNLIQDNSGKKLVSDIRLSLGRDDYEHNLLGPLRASSYLLGDINAVSLSQVTSSGQGRGFTLTNRALDRPDNFDVTNFIGDSRPGWDVELYRNGALIAFQTVGSNGRYEFRDIPVLFGNNEFRLAFYGPQGQRDEIIRTINADSSLLKKGEFTYNISVDQKLKSLFGVANMTSFDSDGDRIVDELGGAALAGAAAFENPNLIDDPDDPKDRTFRDTTGVRVVNELEYGIGKRLTAAVGSALTNIDDRNRTYVTSGLRSSFLGMLVGLDGAYDTTDAGYATRLSVSTRLLDTDIQLLQKNANDFTSEANRNSIISETGINLNKGFDIFLLGEFDNGLTLTRREYESRLKEDVANYRLSKSLLGYNFNNSLRYTQTNEAPSQVDGTVTVHKNIRKLTLYAQADYETKPQKQITRNRLIGLYPLTPGITEYAALVNDFSEDGVTSLENAVTFSMNNYNLSLTGRADEQKEFFIGFSIQTSLGKIPGENAWISSGRPLAHSGALIVRPFIDRNYNSQLDAEDEMLSDVEINVGSRQIKTNKKYYAIATQLPTGLPVDVQLDQGVRDDIYMQNKQLDPSLIAPAYRVVPRPGRITKVDFPVFETSMLDGIVNVPEGVDPEDLRVDLINTEGQVIGSTRTAFDGYYLLEGILPGAYRVRIALDSLNSRQLKQSEAPERLLDKADVYTQDIRLKKQ